MAVSLNRRGFLLAALAAGVLAGCGTGTAADTADEVTGPPRAGGTLKVGIVGGSAKDSLDAHSPVTHPDEARAISLYDTLATYDTNHKIEMSLAEKIVPSTDAKAWTVTLRSGLKFSNGKPITAQDVIYSFKRITDPKDPQSGAAALASLQRDKLQAVDSRTVVFHFATPFVTFADTVSQYSNGIVPIGYDPKNPVSSGPFMLQSFTPGQLSTFVRNPHYWRPGEPYVETLVLFDFPDDTARVNALLGGQVDAIDQLPLSQVRIIQASANLRVLESKTGSWIPFTMRVDQPPFDDVRVRQAMRLIVDREQMISQVLDGHGTVGNDLYAPFDACFAKAIPQRKQDIAQAKKLLAEAGQSNLTVELVTSPAAAGLVEAAQVFAQQAQAAGVTVKVNKVDPSIFYGGQYLKWTFAQDFWFTRDFLPQASSSGFKDSPYNETHWDNAEWTALVTKAQQTLDTETRCALIKKAQQIEWDSGGYIIWGFPNNIDAYSARVHGFVPDKSGIPLTSYRFRSVWLSQ